MIVSVDRFGASIVVGFVFERRGEPLVRIRPRLGDHAHLLAQFAGLKVHCKLAGHRLKARAAVFDKNVFSIGKNAKLRKRRMRVRKLFAKRHQGVPQPAGGHSFCNELLDGAQSDQIAEIVVAAAFFFAGRNEAQAVPVIQLLPGQADNSLNVLRAESVHCFHWKLSGGFLPTGAAAEAAGACFSARLFFNASIRSITGAMCGWETCVTSWPFSLASIMPRTFSVYSSRYFCGSKGAARLSMSCCA